VSPVVVAPKQQMVKESRKNYFSTFHSPTVEITVPATNADDLLSPRSQHSNASRNKPRLAMPQQQSHASDQKCIYHSRGACMYGSMCRFSHDGASSAGGNGESELRDHLSSAEGALRGQMSQLSIHPVAVPHQLQQEQALGQQAPYGYAPQAPLIPQQPQTAGSNPPPVGAAPQNVFYPPGAYSPAAMFAMQQHQQQQYQYRQQYQQQQMYALMQQHNMQPFGMPGAASSFAPPPASPLAAAGMYPPIHTSQGMFGGGACDGGSAGEVPSAPVAIAPTLQLAEEQAATCEAADLLDLVNTAYPQWVSVHAV
jgi:hypothetical protein